MDVDLSSKNWLEVYGVDISSAKLTEIINKRVQARREQLGHDQMQFPSFGKPDCPEKPSGIPYSPNLYHHLHLVNNLYNDVPSELILADSPSLRVPIVGKLWSMVRKQAHQLVSFYVTRAQEHQTEVDRHLINVLNQLTIENQQQQRDIIALQTKLHELEKTLSND